MERIKRDTLLGLVFFGTLGFLLWATINLTDLSLGKAPPLTVYFPTAAGLRIGDPVLVLGKRVGKVDAVDYIGDRGSNQIRVLLRLDEEVALAQNCDIQIQDSSVLGGKWVHIDPGSGAPRNPQQELIGTAAGNALQSVAQFFEGQGPSGQELNRMLLEIRQFFQHMNDPDTTVGALVRRRDLYDEVLGSVQSLRRSLQAIEEGQGLLGRIVKDTTMREDGMRLLANLAAASDALRGTDGLAGRLLNDRQMAVQVQSIVADVQEIVADAKAGKGPLGRVLRDEAMAHELGEALANLNLLLQRANDPEAGPLGRIVADREMGEDLKVALGNLREITDKINSGEGLLATMLNDRELGVRLRRIFTQVSRALEDAREAAPIGNFVQVLTGAF